MMQPPAGTGEPIVVNLTPPEVKVAAGAQPVEIVANVRNAGTTVDQYSVEIENLDPSWYTIGVQSVSLFPGDSAPLPIKIHPPKGSNTRAGHYTFIVRARSHADPALVGVTKGVIQVGSYSIFQVDLAPKRYTGRRGKYNLSLSNGGNNEVQLELTGRDPESNLKYSFKNAGPTVQPGNKMAVPVVVKPAKFRLVGQPEKYPFVLNARPVDGDEKDAREVAGELIHKPIFKGWRRPVLGLIGIFLLSLLLFGQINLCLLPAPVGSVMCQFSRWFHPEFNVPQVGVGGPVKTDCTSGAGFTEVRAKYADKIGGCVEDEWSDKLGNAHQVTQKGQLLYINKGGTAQIYFFGGDNKIYTFVNCKTATFSECDFEEVKKEPPKQ